MATPSVNTTLALGGNRPGSGNPFVKATGFAANTSSTKQYFGVPAAGKLVGIKVSAAVTSDATKTYTYVVTNKSNSDAVMTASGQVYDASPVLTAGTAADLSLSATAASLVVDAGDIIEVDFTGGTGSGITSVVLYFDLTA